MEKNKEISVLKKESKSLSRILGEMKQELDVLSNSQCPASFRKRGEKTQHTQNRRAVTFIQSCWRRLLARKELQRLQNEAKEFFIQLVGDLSTNHLEDRGNDTIQERSNSDFDIKCAIIQFYGNSHNSQSDHWIILKFYVEPPNMLIYLGLKFQIHRSSGRYRNTS